MSGVGLAQLQKIWVPIEETRKKKKQQQQETFHQTK